MGEGSERVEMGGTGRERTKGELGHGRKGFREELQEGGKWFRHGCEIV